MSKRDQEIQNIKEKMNNVEDDVFSSFCESIGISNIRQYEERELRYFFLFTTHTIIISTFIDVLRNFVLTGRKKKEQRKEWNSKISATEFKLN